MQPLNANPPTLLFDGVCNLCSGAVNFDCVSFVKRMKNIV